MPEASEIRGIAMRAADHSWVDHDPGSAFVVLGMHGEGGVSTLTRFAAGTLGSWHTHPGGEEFYVLEGHIRVGGEDFRAGDYLYTPPGGGHRVEAVTDALLFVSLPKLPVYETTPNSGTE